MASLQIPPTLAPKLWPHQIDGIRFALRYLREPFKAPVGLIRMPTGTGKTGIIAVLSIALPPTGWTLVLTPWSNLCDQMIKDLHAKFWKDRDWEPPQKPRVERLYPSLIDDFLGKKDEQLIIVATFATLVTIFNQNREKHTQLAGKLSQVFVDEGHYEPAVEWGRAVKQLLKPTLLLTATPYRNDLKLFDVKKEDVHHYKHEEAEADGVIRKVGFKRIGMEEPTDKQLKAWCKLFDDFWKRPETKRLHKEPRAIICCARMATVKLVTSHLRSLGVDALGIHDRFSREKKKKEWLRDKAPKDEVPYDVWVHQNKLTEGLDDHRFCVVAVLNRIRNDRKLIQQIGRALRRTPKRVGQGRAMVVYSDDLHVKRSWDNYRKFEIQRDMVDPERYYRVLDLMLENQPEMEYFNRRFRARFDRRSSELPAHVLLRASAVVRRTGPKFDLDEFTDFTSLFLRLEDRLPLGPGETHIVGPDDSRLWIYALFGNSSLLVQHSQYEIRLGALAAVKHGELLFLVDTEGAYPGEYLNKYTRKVGDDELGRIFGEKIIPKEVSLINPLPVGATVHHSTIRSDNLDATPAQLTDAVLVCSRVRATVPPETPGRHPRRQYVGFRQGRISEQIRSIEREAFTLNEFVDWSRGLSKLVQAEDRKPPEFFRRYLPRIGPPDDITPHFLVVNLFEGNMELQDPDEEPVELVESVIEVSGQLHGSDESRRFPFELHYRRLGEVDDTSLDGVLAYDVKSERFRVESEDLNTEILVHDVDGGETIGLTTYLNNNDEAFTVVLSSDTYYTDESFYQVDYTYAEERLATLLTPLAALGTATSEKGVDKRRRQWSDSSLFGLISDRRPTALIPVEFGKAEFLFCDDLQNEVSDFVCASFKADERKIAFIHAKHGKGRKVSASAMHDVYAQARKNLGVLSRGGSKPAHLNRWNQDSEWFLKDKKSKKPTTIKIRRWLEGDHLPVRDRLWQKIRTEILDHPDGKKEVWLVLGQTLDKTAFLNQLKPLNRDKRSAATGHLVHLLSGLQAACIQLDVNLRVFCHTT